MDVPLALMRARSMRLMHTFCIAVVGDAFDARDARFEPVGTHVGAHKIKRMPNFGVRTHCSYVQLAIFAFPTNLISRSLFWGTRG